MKKILSILILFVAISTYSQVHTLKESIYFGLGKTSLSGYHKQKLDSIVTLLKNSKSYVGEVKGHTCNLGSVHINKVISNLRALNVFKLFSRQGS
jgi:outer membrane protein OmpA-like peptidoglycan-associated protein